MAGEILPIGRCGKKQIFNFERGRMSAHDPQLNRRYFLHGAASAVAASLLPGEAAAQQDAKPESIADSSAAPPYR